MALFSTIKDKLTDYVETRLKIYQISLEQKAVGLLSGLVMFFISMSFAGLALMFSLIFSAKILNHYTQSDFAGYGIIAVICIFMFLVLSRKHLREYFVDRIRSLIGENINSIKNGGKDNGGL